MELDPFDEILFRVQTEELDWNVVHYGNLVKPLMESVFMRLVLWKLFMGDDLSISQIASMTQGIV